MKHIYDFGLSVYLPFITVLSFVTIHKFSRNCYMLLRFTIEYFLLKILMLAFIVVYMDTQKKSFTLLPMVDLFVVYVMKVYFKHSEIDMSVWDALWHFFYRIRVVRIYCLFAGTQKIIRFLLLSTSDNFKKWVFKPD